MNDETGWVPFFGLGVLAGVILCVCAFARFDIAPEKLAGLEMSYADMAAIMLAAVSVIVTVLGVFIAILALWGFAQFKKSAVKAAGDHVRMALGTGKLKEDIEGIIASEVVRQLDSEKISKIMENRVNRQIYAGAQARAKSERDDTIGDEEKEYGE